jgi:hypothetical protein
MYPFRRTRRQRSNPNAFLISIDISSAEVICSTKQGETRRPALFIQPFMQGWIVRLKSVVTRASRLRAANEICDWTEIRIGCRYLSHSLSDLSVICRVMFASRGGQFSLSYGSETREFLDVTRSIADPGNGM